MSKLVEQKLIMQGGYVFQDSKGCTLAGNGVSWLHQTPNNAYVHPKSYLEELRAIWKDPDSEECKRISDGLEINKPTKVYPAIYSQESDTVMLGEPFDF